MINNREETFDVIILFTEPLISRNNFVKDQHLIKLNKCKSKKSKITICYTFDYIIYSFNENLRARTKLHTENQNWRIEK